MQKKFICSKCLRAISADVSEGKIVRCENCKLPMARLKGEVKKLKNTKANEEKPGIKGYISKGEKIEEDNGRLVNGDFSYENLFKNKELEVFKKIKGYISI